MERVKRIDMPTGRGKISAGIFGFDPGQECLADRFLVLSLAAFFDAPHTSTLPSL